NGVRPSAPVVIGARSVAGRRASEGVIVLVFGSAGIPSPDIAVGKLTQAAHNARNHRYSSSPGIPKLRQAIANLYVRRFGVELDPDTECITTIGAKEGLSHLMWVLLGPGDSVLLPSPSYPIHIYAPLFACAEVQQVLLGEDQDFFANVQDAWENQWPKPRVVIMSFPHNPTTTCVDLG